MKGNLAPRGRAGPLLLKVTALPSIIVLLTTDLRDYCLEQREQYLTLQAFSRIYAPKLYHRFITQNTTMSQQAEESGEELKFLLVEPSSSGSYAGKSTVHDAVYDRLPLMHDDDDDIVDEDSQDTGFVDQENQESQDQISFSGNFVTALVAAFVFIGLPFLYWQHPADSSAFLHLGLDPCDYGNSSNLVQESKLFSRNHPILTMRGLNDDDDVTEHELFLIRRQDGDHDLPLGCSPPSSTSIFERGDSCRCQRVVYRTHKMGYELSEDLFRSTHKVKLNADQLLGDHHYVDHSQQDYAALANATDLALDTYYPTIEDRTDFRHILMIP